MVRRRGTYVFYSTRQSVVDVVVEEACGGAEGSRRAPVAEARRADGAGVPVEEGVAAMTVKNISSAKLSASNRENAVKCQITNHFTKMRKTFESCIMLDVQCEMLHVVSSKRHREVLRSCRGGEYDDIESAAWRQPWARVASHPYYVMRSYALQTCSRDCLEARAMHTAICSRHIIGQPTLI